MAGTVRCIGAVVLSSILLFAAFPAFSEAQSPQACFKADTGPALGESSSMARAAWSPAVPQAAFVETRWNATAFDPTTGTDGDPITVTWGVVDDGVQIAAAGAQYDSPEPLLGESARGL